jgi:hypothetical protein
MESLGAVSWQGILKITYGKIDLLALRPVNIRRSAPAQSFP